MESDPRASFGYITISEAEFNKLKSDSDFLAKLRAAGVDNWEGYDEAQEMED
jgi:hypothetical protein